jgi:Antibiotic biosynthesis monooxygenase
MYTAVRFYKIKSGTHEEISQRVQEGFVKLVSAVSGFIGYYMATTGRDTVMTISIFEDQAGAYESTTIAAKWIKTNLAELVEIPPTVAAGEITIHQTS